MMTREWGTGGGAGRRQKEKSGKEGSEVGLAEEVVGEGKMGGGMRGR